MSQKLRERVNEVLREADTSSGSLVATTDSDGDAETAQTDLLETAAKANDLLESADPDDLLEAVGLDTLPDGTEPDSIPEAISQGEPAHVEALQRLIALSKLADRGDDETLEGAVGELRESIDDGAEDDDSEPETDTGSDTPDEDTDESESDDDGARETIESAAETVSEATGLDGVLGSDEDEAPAGDESDADGAETPGDLGDQLRSAMESSFDGISDDLEHLQDRLEEARASTASDEDESVIENDTTETESDTEDDGLLDVDLGSDRNRGTSGGSGTRYSTMAPPPSERADMRGPVRHSTMPDKD
ncbi:hypothetical protein [Natronorubrum aibiense]|uniref:Uncharacterized protein n=1 Tax=Natronorubrum aibiense TaxID=348826 RepID=A0A5P9P4B6_9EURY|nr:hypothetical protein [Natronorubrum aibiense]QFU83001.1 hypothetical protein GCU68_10875 [Natronorubrum aibiense]